MIITAFTLIWQLFVLFACCLGVGLYLRFLIPKEFSLLNRFLFSFLGGIFLVVLIAQNLVYLEVPVRISAWLLLGAALVQAGLCRHKIGAWTRSCSANAEFRTLGVVILLTITFHGIVPIQQGLEGYYGKGHPDQFNYVVLAEFLKEEPYSTSEQDIRLRPWLARVVGFQHNAEVAGMHPRPGISMSGIKKERIGQSIITAEMCVWSGTDAKSAYAAIVIFFLTVLAICLYVLLRETGIDRFMAGSGALLAAFLPAVTRLSLDGFLSQVSILFLFPFFASLLRDQGLGARSFTLFFSLTLAYLIAAYSEIAPIGLCTFFLGVMFVRRDRFRSKRLMLMSAFLLIALMNPYYLRNLIEFLAQQYYYAANADMEGLVPKILTLRAWSELVFGVTTSWPLALFLDCCTILLGLLFFAGAIFLSGRDRLVSGAILVPVILVILYLATRTSHSSYPIVKITLSILPFVIALVFVALSKVAPNNQNRSLGVLKKLVSASIVAAAAGGSFRYYSEVLDSRDMLSYVREPHFLNVCHQLEEIKNKRVLVFETHPWLTMWLCYHARHNDVYFGGGYIDSPIPLPSPFSTLPDLKSVDLVVTRDRIVDLRAPAVPCLTLVDDTPGEDRTDGRIRYWLGPPAFLHFLAIRAISANLKMRLAPGPEAAAIPVDYFLADHQGHVSQGELWGGNVDVRRMNFPRGLSTLRLAVRGDPNAGQSFPIVAELDGVEVSDIEFNEF